MSIYDLNLSQYTTPKVRESVSREWVEIEIDSQDPNIRKKERWYDFIIARYNNSATNSAILNNIIKLTYGDGLTARDAKLKPNDYARLVSLFGKQAVKNVITDYCILGTGSFQVAIKKGEVVKVDHIPRNLLNPEKCNEDGDIEAYYYSDDWSDTYKYVPERIPVLTKDAKDGLYLVVFGEYSIGKKYQFSLDYFGGLDYAILEEKISEYQINDADNGFSPTTVINYNNGETDTEKQKEIVRKTEEKATGVNGKRTIIAFNQSKETAVTVDQFPLNDAPAHYEYLSRECREKLLAAHNVVSSMIVGIAKDGQGFASTADEIEVAIEFFHKNTISYKQEVVIDAIDSILAFSGVSLDLMFKKSQIKPEATPQQVQMSEHDNDIFNKFNEVGEVLGEDWVLVDSRKVDYEMEAELDAHIHELNNPKQSVLAKLKAIVNTGTARPNAKSEQDNEKFKTRYRYTGETTPNSRPFCVKMTGANKVYRKEDIMQMSDKIVNQGWGPEGADKYDIWLYKGGGNCGHYWVRETYAKKSDVNNPNAQTFTPAQQRKAGFIAPKNDKKVYQKPRDMKNNGFLNPQ